MAVEELKVNDNFSGSVVGKLLTNKRSVDYYEKLRSDSFEVKEILS